MTVVVVVEFTSAVISRSVCIVDRFICDVRSGLIYDVVKELVCIITDSVGRVVDRHSPACVFKSSIAKSEILKKFFVIFS